MSYDSRKQLPGQEFVEEVELRLDACRYSISPYIDNNTTTFSASLGPTYTGTLSFFNLANEAQNTAIVDAWDGESLFYIYMPLTGEIMSANNLVYATFDIVARGLFGTVAIDIPGPAATTIVFMHQGQADQSCRGFPHTCSNANSYSATAKRIMTFSTAQYSGGAIRFPGLYHKACRHKSGEVEVGESIGSRSSLNFRIQDQLHNDFYIVPYPERRSSNGTMFGKLLARHPYMNGREVIYREGYRDAGSLDSPEWIERRFIIENANLSNGYFTVSALDPLILTEDKKAKMPVASPAVLSAAITGYPATFSFVDAPAYYFGPMSSTRYVRIDGEVIVCTVSGTNQLTVVTRGYRSEVKDHDAGASIQDCVVFQGTNGIDAIVFALENYTNIPAEFIDDYSAVKALLPAFEFDEAILTKPEAVVNFLNNCIKLGNLIFYFNEVTQKIAIEYIPELQAQPISINGLEHIGRGSVKVDFNIKNQWTRFAHLWGAVDITKDSEENYAIRYTAINLGLEAADQLGETSERKEHRNMLLTTSSSDTLIGIAYASRVISETELPPKIIDFMLDAKSVGNFSGGYLGPGSIIDIATDENQDKDGNALSELFQVLRVDGNGYIGFDVRAKKYSAVQPNDIDFVVGGSENNYDLSDYYTPAAGNYTIYIEPGLIFGSYSTSVPAFTTGAQSPGVSFTIINRGSMFGQGGAGGDAGIIGSPSENGQNGGIAFEATVPVVINNGAGIIWAGGGGGAGEEYLPPPGPGAPPVPRSGGGGGQGFGVSAPGLNSNGVTLIGGGEVGGRSGPGGNAGEWGAPGGNTATNTGGFAGEAIKSNGNAVTITSGDNDFNIRGRRT